jgi:methyl-accepting chemotaxis protein
MSNVEARWFEKVRIGPRLWFGYGLTMSLTAAALCLALALIHTLRARQDRYATEAIPSILAIHELVEAVDRARESEMLYVLSDDAAGAREDRAKVDADLQGLSGASHQRLQQFVEEYWGIRDRVVAMSRDKRDPAQRTAAVKLLLGESKAAFDRLEDAARSQEREWRSLADTLRDERNTDRKTLIAVIIVFVFALQVGLRSAQSTARFLTQPLDLAVEMAKAVASGDLTKRVGAESLTWEVSLEVKALLIALNDMAGQLAGLISDMSQSADGVNVTAHRIAESSEELGRHTHQQASELRTAAASMDQMTSIGENNAASAADADGLARAAQAAAENGGIVVSEAVAAMDAINRCSGQISNIIGLIDNIAFQTNLLALNAAVEAARAGEQGRGFAVVASEVRGLAQRSADAAKEIKALIRDSAEKVRAGTQLVDRTGRALADILGSVREATQLISQIANGSREQSSGLRGVTQTIVRLDTATEHNLTLMEDCIGARHTLEEYAGLMARRVSSFRVEQLTRG